MTGQYKHPTIGWRPIATVSGGGSVEKLQLDASGGSTKGASIAQSADDRIWDHLEPYSGGTNLSHAFYSMPSITRVPMFDTSGVTDMTSMFNGCRSLVVVPELDTSSVTSMITMFTGCSSLVVVPELDTSNVTQMVSLFSGCSSLVEIPPLVTSSVTNMASMFNNCSSLVEIPPFDTSNVTNMNNMFYGCSSLVEIPELDMSAATSLSSFAGSTYTSSTQLSSLTRFKAFGATRGFLLPGTNMDAAALNELMSNLGTADGVQTLNIRNSPGSSTCDPSIATAKGWTVLT